MKMKINPTNLRKPLQQYEIGMVGLGVMGRNLLRQEAENRHIRGAADIKEFIALLRKPRAVMMLVPAGPPVDSVINELLAHLQPGDLIIDAGNSYFKDTDVRLRNLAAKGIQFLGVGASGREEGARHVPGALRAIHAETIKGMRSFDLRVEEEGEKLRELGGANRFGRLNPLTVAAQMRVEVVRLDRIVGLSE